MAAVLSTGQPAIPTRCAPRLFGTNQFRMWLHVYLVVTGVLANVCKMLVSRSSEVPFRLSWANGRERDGRVPPIAEAQLITLMLRQYTWWAFYDCHWRSIASTAR